MFADVDLSKKKTGTAQEYHNKVNENIPITFIHISKMKCDYNVKKQSTIMCPLFLNLDFGHVFTYPKKYILALVFRKYMVLWSPKSRIMV